MNEINSQGAFHGNASNRRYRLCSLNDLIIVPLVAGIGNADDELYTLNETGKAIWHKLDGQRSLAAVANELAGDFCSSSDVIKADVLGFASEMVKLGILAVRN